MISIKGLDKAAVLAALYNGAKAQNFGNFVELVQVSTQTMTVEEARQLLGEGDDVEVMFPGMNEKRGSCTYFDYLKGRVLKSDIGGDELDTWGYDHDNGPGAALAALKSAGLIT